VLPSVAGVVVVVVLIVIVHTYIVVVVVAVAVVVVVAVVVAAVVIVAGTVSYQYTNSLFGLMVFKLLQAAEPANTGLRQVALAFRKECYEKVMASIKGKQDSVLFGCCVAKVCFYAL